jgi:hypothetical protein
MHGSPPCRARRSVTGSFVSARRCPPCSRCPRP